MRAALQGKLALRDRFLARLGELAKERDSRPDVVETEFGVECAWAQFERDGMLADVNRARAERGFAPTTAGAIRAADLPSSGHVDYAEKFSLYCAEITLRELP